MTALPDIAVSHVHLVTHAALLPVSRMILLTTAAGREFAFARHVVGRAGLPQLSAVDEAGQTYEPPLVMTISRSGYLLSLVEQEGETL